MNDSALTTPASPRRRNWLKILGIVVGCLVALLVVGYLVLTSGAFFKGVILPRVGRAMNASVTVSDASISPFSQVVLTDFKVQTTGTDPLITAKEVRLQYSLTKIMGGNLDVALVSVNQPTINLVKNPDGTSNLDPILKANQQPRESAQPSQPPPSGKSKPVQVNLGKLAITDATLRQVTIHPGGKRDVAELHGFNLTVQNVRNGGEGSVTLTSALRLENNPPDAPEKAASAEGTMDGKFQFSLTKDLQPAGMGGKAALNLTKATGTLAQAAGFEASLDLQVTPDQVKELALRLAKGGHDLGQLLVNGPFSMERNEGQLSIRLHAGKNLFDLAGASSGLAFGNVSVDCTNVVAFANKGSAVTAVGRFALDNLQVSSNAWTTPRLDLSAAYDIHANTAASNLVIKVLSIDGRQNSKPILTGELARPMTLAWGNTSNAVGDSTFKAALTNLDLADWKPLLGQVAPAGKASGALVIFSRQQGKLVDISLDAGVQNLTALMGTNPIPNLSVGMQLLTRASEFKNYTISNFVVQAQQADRELFRSSLNGTMDTEKQAGELLFKADAYLANVVKLLRLESVDLQTGVLSANTRLTLAPEGQLMTGTVTLAALTGNLQGTPLQSLGAQVNLDLATSTQKVVIRNISGRLTQASNTAGTFGLKGTHMLTNNSGQITAALTNLNQDFLRPFLQGSLTPKRLESMAINGSVDANYSLTGNSAIKAGLSVTNLVISDPANPKLVGTPLELNATLDAARIGDILELRNASLGLSPTERATNTVSLTGRIDLSNTNTTSGNLKLSADSLDFTRYYDLFAGPSQVTKANPASAPSATPAPAPATPAPQEPRAMKLPFTNFVAEAAVRALYLHEVEITNLQTTVRIDGGQVRINPVQLGLNGAPVKGVVNFDLGVPGWKYDLDFSARQVPLAPLANSFVPDKKGQVGGTFTGVAKIAGQGTSGTSLKEHLSGGFYFGSTNLNLSVVNLKSPMLRTLVNVVGLIPELVKSPDAALGSFLSSAMGGGKGGLSDELARSPLDIIVAGGNIANGEVNLTNAVVRSLAFNARATGVIGLADPYTNSTLHLPIEIALSRAVSERLNIVPAGTPTNQAFVDLPQFVTMNGTAGTPKTDINKLALLKLGAQSLGANKLGGQAGALLGGLLGTGSKTNAPGTSGTNQSSTGALLQGLGGLLGGSSHTNAPGTGTNAAPATNPIPNLLDGLLKPRKK